MRSLVIGLFALSLFVISCSEEENTDSTTEVSCTAATGTWYVGSATCNGVASSAAPQSGIALTFDSLTAITQVQGPEACQSTVQFDLVHGSANPTVELTGNGTESCSASGSSVPSCSSGGNSCSGANMTGLAQNFDTCVISGSTMSLSRVVSAANSQVGSFCADGEQEVMNLTQTAPTPPAAPSTALLVMSGSNPINFGSVAVASNNPMSLTITNSGSVTATSMAGSGLVTPFNFTGGVYPGTAGTCAASLAPGASCTIEIQFAPSVAGAANDTIDINYNDGAAAQVLSRPVQGVAVGGAVLIISESDPYAFGTIPNLSTVSHVFTVINVGGATATSISASGLVAPFQFVGGAYPGVGGTCGATVVAAGACTMNIEYAPTSTGLASDRIELNYNDGSTMQMSTRDVQGNAF